MTEEIAELLGVKAEVIARLVQYLAAVIGIIAFLVFFAISGLLVILASLYFKAEKSIQKAAFYVGAGLMAVGFMGIFIPSVTTQLLSLASELEELLVFPLGG